MLQKCIRPLLNNFSFNILLHSWLKESLNTYVTSCTALPMQCYPCEAQPADMLTRVFLTFQMPAMSSLLFQTTLQCILIPCIQNQKNTKQKTTLTNHCSLVSLPPSLGSSRLQGPVLNMFIKTHLFTVKFLIFKFFQCHRVCRKRTGALVRAITRLEHKYST